VACVVGTLTKDRFHPAPRFEFCDLSGVLVAAAAQVDENHAVAAALARESFGKR
jgi:hypothetical protein